MRTAIDEFVASLANAPRKKHVFNPYSFLNKDGKLCRENLTHYLNILYDQKPGIMLLGEAPGYRGCVLTGIPFSCEQVLHSPCFERFRSGNGRFHTANNGGSLSGEQSSFVVWEAIGKFPQTPLLWNAYPFHPYNKGNFYSNRTPGKWELESGITYVKTLLELFNIRLVVAVGRIAEKSLFGLNKHYITVRHPAHGGKHIFLKQMSDILAGETYN